MIWPVAAIVLGIAAPCVVIWFFHAASRNRAAEADHWLIDDHSTKKEDIFWREYIRAYRDIVRKEIDDEAKQ